MLKKFDLYGFTALTEAEKDKINTKKIVKSRSQSCSVRPSADLTSQAGSRVTVPGNLDQLSEVAQHLLNDANLEVSKVRPFFWSLVETYVDRFQVYPFDVTKALFCYLESGNSSEAELRHLIGQLEALYEKNHGAIPEPLSAAESGEYLERQPAKMPETAHEEIERLRACIKYAARVSEV